jgi:hypothetical protein
MISLKSRWILACFAIVAAVSFQSCNDEDSYDVEGDPTNKIFINTQEWSPANAGSNFLAFSFLHTPIGEVGKVRTKIAVRSTLPVTKVTTVNAEVVDSLVKSYNNAYKTSYATVPAGVVNIEKLSVSIEEGKTLSTDSLTISIDSAKLATLTETAYLVPIKLVSVTGSSAKISSDNSVVYMLVKRTVTNNYPSPIATDMVGTTIASRTSWTASMNVAFSNAVTRLFDAKTSTYIMVSPSQPCALTVDMAAEYSNITGIRIHSYGTSYSINAANISSSSDGVNWVSQGQATLSGATAYQYIKFYSPVTARYLKVEITSYKSANYIVLAEFDVYVN